ncbi:MAG: DUF4861 family protein [Phycisphaerales bacterium]
MRKLWMIVAAVFFGINAAAVNGKLFINATNVTTEGRDAETISIPLIDLGAAEVRKPAIYCEKLGRFVASQYIDNNADGIFDEIVFQTDIKAKQTMIFEVVEANAANQVEVLDGSAAYYVPQRKDDFAWENDKIAFRVYGQELQRTELTSSGIDVWVKKVQKPVMPKLYIKGHDYYHSDNPLGIDFYNVGPSLGCGGLGAWYDGKLLLSQNYNEWKIIANGPIRTIFELTYRQWNVGGGKKTGEVKRITLDKGWNFNKIESKFSNNVKDVKFAVGIVKCERGGNATFGILNEYMGYWQKIDKNFGIIGCGVILSPDSVINEKREDQDNNMLLAEAKDNFVVYYAGACWNKNKGFETEEKWNALIRQTERRIKNPVKIEYKQKFGKR